MNEELYQPHSEEEAKEDEEMNLEQEAEKILETVKELVPEEKQEELAEKAEKLAEPKPVMGSLEALKSLFAQPTTLGKGQPTSEHNPKRKGGVGITRKDKSPSKKSRKTSKNSRRRNRGK